MVASSGSRGLRGPSRFARAVVLAALSAGAACAAPPGPLTVDFTSTDAAIAKVRVSGLSSAETSALRAASLDRSAWQRILLVSTSTDSTVAMAGTYTVSEQAIEFAPAFPFDAGRAYTTRFNPSKMPVPRSAGLISRAVDFPRSAASAPVVVTAIYPSASEWPANLLRFYVHFSGPMAREVGAARVRILDDAGEDVADALLPASSDFWSPDQTRHTALFEPGRVKRGIQPNVDMGRALVPGREYTVLVDEVWRDAHGRPLAAPFRRRVRVGPPRGYPLSLDAWAVGSPAAGSSEPLTVRVPAPLDHALFLRTVGVTRAGQPVAGVVEVSREETEWRFTPRQPWERAGYELTILSALEDPAGNRIGRAFEVLPTDPAANIDLPERFTRPIGIR